MSVGLVDILKQCLATRSGDRYEDAATLAEDLRRELNDLPLRGVRNRSVFESFSKWRRRHPGALAWSVVGMSIAMAVGLGLGAAMVVYQQRVGQVRLLLDDGRRARTAGRFEEAVRALGRGLESAAAFPAPVDLRASLRSELRLAEQGRLAEDLHDLADRVRARYGVELPSRAEGETLLRLCRAVWERKNQLLAAGIPLADEANRAIRTDLLELAAILSDLCVAFAPAGGLEAAKRDARLMLDDAELLCGPSFALAARRDELDDRSGRAGSRAGGRVPSSAWEHYELGRYNLRAGRLADAAGAFQQAVDLRPQDFWANFYHGLCSFRLGRFDEAAADFRVCLAIEPGSGVAHYNRALALDSLGRSQDAFRGYTKAIELAPQLAAARLNRGIISYKDGRHTAAVADFKSGLEAGPDREMSGRLRFNLALAQLELGDRRSAKMNAEKAMDLGFPEAKSLLDGLK